MELLITGLAGASILIGALATHLLHNTRRVGHISVALALGALLALLIFDLLPEIAEYRESAGNLRTGILILAGLAILKGLDIFVPDHHDTGENHDHENAVHIGMIASLAIILHNLVEGMTVYSLSLVSISDGIILAIGVAMHNVPMGMLIDSTLGAKTRAQRYALLLIVTLSTFAGGLLMHSVSGYLTEQRIGALVSLATGMILYIVFLELLPHVIRTEEKKLSILSAGIGFAIVLVSCTVFE